MESCWRKGQAQIETQIKLRLGPIKLFHNSLMSDLSKNKHENFHQKEKKKLKLKMKSFWRFSISRNEK
jgi:hypothetical protein